MGLGRAYPDLIGHFHAFCGRIFGEMSVRARKVWVTFINLHCFWRERNGKLFTKCFLLQKQEFRDVTVRPTLLYEFETWGLRSEHIPRS